MNETDNQKNYNWKIKNSRWSNFWNYIILMIGKSHYKLLNLLIDLENGKEYNPGNLGVHNYKMLMDTWYKFAYYSKCTLYRIRFNILNFLVDLIITIVILIFFCVLFIVTLFVTYCAYTVLVI